MGGVIPRAGVLDSEGRINKRLAIHCSVLPGCGIQCDQPIPTPATSSFLLSGIISFVTVSQNKPSLPQIHFF